MTQILGLKPTFSRSSQYRGAHFFDCVGTSANMQNVYSKLSSVAPTNATVLLTGETGTGKELLARAIHALSLRKTQNFVRVNCAALPSELIESEFFGHERGAFTGAVRDRQGYFERADKGTLLLDEVSELSPSAQAKLLRVLQEQEFERVGSCVTRKVNVRVIASCNRDLPNLVRLTRFRADLFYRLNVFPVTVPPLRERISDIPLLSNHFLDEFNRSLDKSLERMSNRSMNRMQNYAWPGNVRELRNSIERAAILSEGPEIVMGKLAGPGLKPATREGKPLVTLEALERDYIQRVLASTGWAIEGNAGAASILGLHPSTLRSRIRKLGIEKICTPIRNL